MHLEILVEDQSGAKALGTLMEALKNDNDTFRIHPYKGIGKIPSHMRDTENASDRILLENLPKLLKGYGRTFSGYPPETPAAVVLVCDLDDRVLGTFISELRSILDSCNPAPLTRFCIAIEEGEAWFLGDIPAVKSAYPSAKDDVLQEYVNDSICGTWEKLADAVYPGGSVALSREGYGGIGREKSRWSENITPLMDLNLNNSPSFMFFRDTILGLLNSTPPNPRAI